MPFTKRTKPSIPSKVKYKKLRFPRKKKKLLKKKFSKFSPYQFKIMLRCKLIQRAASKILPSVVYSPYISLVETIQIDPTEFDMSKYCHQIPATYYGEMYKINPGVFLTQNGY